MELSKKAITELKSLRLEYEQKEVLADLKFVKSYMDILSSEDKFKGVVDLEITDDRSYYAEEGLVEENGKILSRIYINIDNVFAASPIILSGFEDIAVDSDINAKNYFMMYSLLHESSHIWQDQGLDNVEEVNRFYRLMVKKNFANNIFYRFWGEFFSPERHANIDANTFLIDIYNDSSLSTIAKTYYLNLILFMYGKMSPTKKTQLMLLSFDKFNVKEMDVMKRLEVGFPVDKEIIKSIDNELIREARGETDFYECKKRILGITNGVR